MLLAVVVLSVFDGSRCMMEAAEVFLVSKPPFSSGKNQGNSCKTGSKLNGAHAQMHSAKMAMCKESFDVGKLRIEAFKWFYLK